MPAQTVLAVDDDPSIRWLLEEIFAISGIPHTVMGSGLESIEWARTGRPVLAIVDVRLNGVDGIGIARRIAEVSPETRILFLTGYADTVRANVSQAELPHMLLEKPFDINVLLDTVREACRVGSGAGEQVAFEFADYQAHQLHLPLPLGITWTAVARLFPHRRASGRKAVLLSDVLTLDDWLLTLWVAGRHGVDPLLLIAIGWRETNWGRRGAGRRGWHLGYGYFPGSPVLERYRGLRNQLEGAAAQLARDLGDDVSHDLLRRFARESWRPGDPTAWADGVWRVYCALTDDLSRLLGEEPRLVRGSVDPQAWELTQARTEEPRTE